MMHSKNSPQEKSQVQVASLGENYQTCNFSFINLKNKIKDETLSNSLSKVRIILIPKSDKNTQEKKSLHANSMF